MKETLPLSTSQNNFCTFQRLTERNKDVIIFVNNDGITPTDIAIMTGEIELLELFFRSKKLDSVSKSKFIYISCELKQLYIIQWLIDHGPTSESDSSKHFGDVCHCYSWTATY